MGKRGPQPQPTAVLARRGSWRAKIRVGEPRPSGEIKPAPDWLDGDAAEMWDFLLPQLTATGVMTRIDWATLARYCEMWSQWLVCRADPERFDRYMRLNGDLLKIEREFGMTPSSRSSIKVDPPAENANNKLRFFK